MRRFTTKAIEAKVKAFEEAQYEAFGRAIGDLAADTGREGMELLTLASQGVLYEDNGTLLFVQQISRDGAQLWVEGDATPEALGSVVADAFEQLDSGVAYLTFHDQSGAPPTTEIPFLHPVQFPRELIRGRRVATVVYEAIRSEVESEGPKAQAQEAEDEPPTFDEEEFQENEDVDFDEELTDGTDRVFAETPPVPPAVKARQKKEQLQSMLNRVVKSAPGVRQSITLERDNGG